MKKVLICLILLCSFICYSQDVWVDGYYRNGTYVKGHYRTRANGTKSDNYSTEGNVNPYTGKPGTVNPYPDNNQIGETTIFVPSGEVVPYYYENSQGVSYFDKLFWQNRYNEQQKTLFLYGREYANVIFRPRRYTFWVPAVTTALFIPAGIISGIVCDITGRRKTTIDDNEYFQRGYNKRMRRKVFWKTFGGVAIGVVVNLLIIRKIYH